MANRPPRRLRTKPLSHRKWKMGLYLLHRLLKHRLLKHRLLKHRLPLRLTHRLLRPMRPKLATKYLVSRASLFETISGITCPRPLAIR